MGGQAETIGGETQRAHPGFWRHWPVAKVLVFASIALGLLRQALGGPGAFGALVVYLAVWNWISRDHRNHPGVLSKYGGAGFFVLWPLLVTFYLIETRGWKRAATAMAAVVGIAVISAIVGGALILL